MRNTIIMPALVATLTLIAIVAPASAQTQPADTLTPGRVLLDRAEELHREHRTRDALALYTEAADALESESELPLKPLQRIATIHLAAGRIAAAAGAMDRLAGCAEWQGFPDVQARALLEAAALYQEIGERGAARERIRRLQPLLGSPHVGKDITDRIRSRMTVITAAR